MESHTRPGMERHRADHISTLTPTEIPNPKLQVPKKFQPSKFQTRGGDIFEVLELGIWNFFGCWNLEFGASAKSCLELAPLPPDLTFLSIHSHRE
jgi:hypothetical protein